MTEKRFKLIDGIKKGTHSGIWDNQKQHNQGIGDELWLGEVVGMLNEGVILAEEKKQLKEEIIEWKSKYFDAMDTVIHECSTNIKKDMEELEKEVWGDVE